MTEEIKGPGGERGGGGGVVSVAAERGCARKGEEFARER